MSPRLLRIAALFCFGVAGAASFWACGDDGGTAETSGEDTAIQTALGILNQDSSNEIEAGTAEARLVTYAEARDEIEEAGGFQGSPASTPTGGIWLVRVDGRFAPLSVHGVCRTAACQPLRGTQFMLLTADGNVFETAFAPAP